MTIRSVLIQWEITGPAHLCGQLICLSFVGDNDVRRKYICLLFFKSDESLFHTVGSEIRYHTIPCYWLLALRFFFYVDEGKHDERSEPGEDEYVLRRFFDLRSGKKGHVRVGVVWEDGTTTYEPLKNVAHAGDMFDNFTQWVNAGCPDRSESRRGNGKAAVGDRPMDDRHLPTIDDGRMFVRQTIVNTCVDVSAQNARIALGMEPVPRDGLVGVKVVTKEACQSVLRSYGLRVARRKKVSNVHMRTQPMERGVYVAVASVVNSMSKHAFVIDARTKGRVVVVDGVNTGCVAYSEESLYWVRSWCVIYQVIGM